MQLNRIYTALFGLILSSCSLSAQQFDVDTLIMNGHPDFLINIVILGDGYQSNELPIFVTDAQNMTDHFFDELPFREYEDYFNVFMIKVPSNESGAALDPDSLIDNYFGSAFWMYGIERLLVPNHHDKIINALSDNFPAYDQVIMLVNSSKYGGSGGWVATASTHPDVVELVLHEIGHSFSGLADEYWAGEQYAAENINMTQETDLEKLRWKNWYGDFDIGLYPHEESPSWYRPHQDCKMRFLGRPFCSVCTEGTIERIHYTVAPLKSYSPAHTTISEFSYPLEFKISLIEPDPNTLMRIWELNSEFFKRNTDSISVTENDLAAGTNILSVYIEDTTQLLHVDNHSMIHYSYVTWEIHKGSTGIESVTSFSNNITISFYPNPFNDYLNIKVQGELKDEVVLEICNMQGSIERSVLLNNNSANTLNLKDLSSGLYLAKVYMNGTFITSGKIFKIE